VSTNTLSRERLKKIVEERTLQDWIRDIGPFAMLAVLVVIFTVLSEQFLTYDNLVTNVTNNSIILLLVALAGTFPILQQSIDLSTPAIVGFAGVITALLIPELGPFALIVAVGAGGVVGGLNGIVFAKLKIPSFLATLGSMSIIEGATLLLTDGSSVPFRAPSVRTITNAELLFGIPNLVLWGLLTYLVVVFIARQTSFGRFCYALGESETVAELSGVKVDRYKIGAFVISGLLCGIAGALLAARISSASASMSDGLLLQSIAAIVMGGTALTGGVGGPHRTILGVLVIAVLQNGMNLIGIQQFVQSIILGAVVILAVAMSIDKRKIDVVK
jgi:ribose/xylose/arabinose/galactoside ABC-type transport system permease subunit